MRFFEKHADKVVPALDGCWHWAGSAGRYGFVHYRGSTWNAHRAAFDAATDGGAIGNVVRHTCDQPLCVNPAHLIPGTHADNTADMMARGRHGGGYRPGAKGSAAYQAKLTESAVRDIRRRYIPRHPEHGFCALAREYGADPAAVRLAYLGRTWGHV